MARKLPFLSKEFKELGLVGRASYIASALTAVGAASIMAWQIWVWANNNQLSIAEEMALSQYQEILRIERLMIHAHINDENADVPALTTRSNEITEELKELKKRLDN